MGGGGDVGRHSLIPARERICFNNLKGGRSQLRPLRPRQVLRGSACSRACTIHRPSTDKPQLYTRNIPRFSTGPTPTWSMPPSQRAPMDRLQLMKGRNRLSIPQPIHQQEIHVGFQQAAIFSRRDAPEACREITLERGRGRPSKEGAGNAGCECTRSRACSVESTRVSHHEYTGAIRHPRAMIFFRFPSGSPW
jgi:hypothetical protein